MPGLSDLKQQMQTFESIEEADAADIAIGEVVRIRLSLIDKLEFDADYGLYRKVAGNAQPMRELHKSEH